MTRFKKLLNNIQIKLIFEILHTLHEYNNISNDFFFKSNFLIF